MASFGHCNLFFLQKLRLVFFSGPFQVLDAACVSLEHLLRRDTPAPHFLDIDGGERIDGKFSRVGGAISEV